jgi:heme exporter protein D
VNFYFHSFSDFFWMDGHGPFVWVSYFVTIAAFLAIALSTKIRKAKFVKQQRALSARQAGQNVTHNQVNVDETD